jgi:lysozyme
MQSSKVCARLLPKPVSACAPHHSITIMTLIAEGIALITAFESCRLKAYRCPAGLWTIGYGHTGAEVHDGLTITQAEADGLLRTDLAKFDTGVLRLCPQSRDTQHAAMVSLAYNIGLGNFANSSVARLHNAGRYGYASKAFALWNRVDGEVLPGLTKRRAAEASLYLRDADPDPDDYPMASNDNAHLTA